MKAIRQRPRATTAPPKLATLMLCTAALFSSFAVGAETVKIAFIEVLSGPFGNAGLGSLNELRAVELPDWLDPADVEDRNFIRAEWDKVEQMMRDYLAALRDEMLFEKPVPEGEDKDLITWQILLHVVNHGTDHRAQILRVLYDFGVRTGPQDYIFYAYDHPMP